MVPDFGFEGYYLHAPSGLSLTMTRAYSSNQGRFINRDTIAEVGGINLFGYIDNNPIGGADPSGMDPIDYHDCNRKCPDGTPAIQLVTRQLGVHTPWYVCKGDPILNPNNGNDPEDGPLVREQWEEWLQNQEDLKLWRNRLLALGGLIVVIGGTIIYLGRFLAK